MKLKAELNISLKMSSCKLAKCFLSQQIEDIEKEMSEKMSDRNASKVTDQISELSLGEGKFSQVGMWKLKSKLCPKTLNPPIAKNDQDGNLVTAPSQLKQLYIKTYQHRLRHRKMDGKYSDILLLKNELWVRRFEQCRKKTTNPWTIDNIDKAIKSLKNNQSRDPLGMINELFKSGIMGTELKSSTLCLMNNVKAQLFVPRNMQLSNFTTIFKNKGSRL